MIPALVLRVPTGVMVQSAGDEGTGTEWSAEAVAQGSTSVPELGSHLAAQVVDAGWIPVDSTITPTLETRTWRLRTETRSWQAQLTVAASAPAMPSQLRITVSAVR
jgi:hypothetical protein